TKTIVALKVIKQEALQIEFDDFRNETGTDTQHLKASHAELTKAKADLEMQVVKVNSALNNLQERYNSVSEHSAFQKSEKKELFARIKSLLHTQTLLETRLQDATATLVTLAKSGVSAIQEKMQMQEAVKTTQIQSLQTTITGLEEEVHALKGIQLDAVSDRLGSMHNPGQPNLASNEENHTATIRNLRREKEILEQECSLATQKTNRIQLQMQNLQRSLDNTRAALNQERQKGEMNSDSGRLHRELMSKIDRVNVLNESNATLRSQNTSLTLKIEHLESLIKVKEADLGPLRGPERCDQCGKEGAQNSH
ncbi:hypothetical protein HDU78_011404, partial [Chytriomyces hyalinus]